jgi:hypothetical protein
VAPVAPILIDNPEPIDIGGGVTIPVGKTPLQADQVGPYLRAQKYVESGRDRLNRSQAFWAAWLAQVAASKKPDAVPGETSVGIGRFIRALAKGQVDSQILPVDRLPGNSGLYRIQKKAVNDLVTDLVPSPIPAYIGSRFTIRLLDGVSAGSIPQALTRQLVHVGGAVTVIGNGPAFGQQKTTIVYANPNNKKVARRVLKALGGTGTATLDREAPDTVDITVLLGKDILGDSPSPTNSTVAPDLTTTTGAN